MGESQCPTCQHIVTGFEQQEFEAGMSVLAGKDAEIERLKGKLAQCAVELAEAALLLRPNFPQMASIFDTAANVAKKL